MGSRTLLLSVSKSPAPLGVWWWLWPMAQAGAYVVDRAPAKATLHFSAPGSSLAHSVKIVLSSAHKGAPEN